VNNYELSSVHEEIVKCMKCGTCQSVCPLYKATSLEPLVARGKIKLAEAVLKGEIDYTPKIARRFEECLTCMACVANCPSGVRVDKIILAARATIAKKRGMPKLFRYAAQVIKRPRLFDLAMKTAGKTQGLVFKKVSPSGQSPRFQLVGIDKQRILPQFAPTPYRDRVPEVNKPTAEDKGLRVAFFTGCMANYIYPETSEAATSLLTSLGVTVIVPHAQHCCGIPVFVHGDVDTMRKIAEEHVRIFSSINCDAVITVCGTCGESFAHYYPELLSGEMGDKAKAIAEKTMDVTDFIIKYDLYPFQKAHSISVKVTYHSPCHLDRGMGVYEQPLELIKNTAGSAFVSLKAPTTCCGGAGSFSFTNQSLSSMVLKSKIADIKNTEADVVLTGCSACRMQLEEGLAKEGQNIKVRHTVEFLAQALSSKKGKPGESNWL